MGIYKLPLKAAKECLDFSKMMMRQQDKIPDEIKISEDFKKALNDFTNFMELSVNSEFELITIPDRHQKIYNSLVQSLVLFYII